MVVAVLIVALSFYSWAALRRRRVHVKGRWSNSDGDLFEIADLEEKPRQGRRVILGISTASGHLGSRPGRTYPLLLGNRPRSLAIVFPQKTLRGHVGLLDSRSLVWDDGSIWRRQGV